MLSYEFGDEPFGVLDCNTSSLYRSHIEKACPLRYKQGNRVVKETEWHPWMAMPCCLLLLEGNLASVKRVWPSKQKAQRVDEEDRKDHEEEQKNKMEHTL